MSFFMTSAEGLWCHDCLCTKVQCSKVTPTMPGCRWYQTQSHVALASVAQNSTRPENRLWSLSVKTRSEQGMVKIGMQSVVTATANKTQL